MRVERGDILIEKYRVEEKIGEGGMGNVYLVKDIRVDKFWAMKVVTSHKDSVAYQQLKQEMAALTQLENTGLPTIIDAFYIEDIFAIVMEYVEGTTLMEYRKQRDDVTEEQVVAWAVRLTEILTYLHTRTPHLIYGDVKPANIIIKSDGSLKLIDFGTIMEESMDEKGIVRNMGTYGYAAPEKLLKGQTDKDARGVEMMAGMVDCRSDIYSLGATLFYLMTGIDPAKPPYQLQPIRRVNSALSEGLEHIIKRCTEKEPKKRYQSCEECRQELLRYKQLEQRKHIGLWLQRMFSRVLFASAIFLSGIGVWCGTQEKKIYGKYLLGSTLMAIIALGYRYYVYFKERKTYFYTRQTKNIFCTEKSIIGLCLFFILLFGFPSHAKSHEAFFVEVTDVQGRNILIREGSIFSYSDILTFTWNEANEVQYQLSTNGSVWNEINGSVYQFDKERINLNDTNVTITFRTWEENSRMYLKKCFTLALS